jgi:hypothetical protein
MAPRPGRSFAPAATWNDGAVMVCEINEENDRLVGKPQEQGVMNIAASFSLSKKPRFNCPGGGQNTTEGDAR